MPEITRDEARALVARFSEFAPPPALTEGLSQTIDTLIGCARSKQHVRRIVEAIIESPGDPPRWPTSERIRKLAWDLLSDSEKRTRCERCDGSGWITRERTIRSVVYSGQEACSCRPAPPAKSATQKPSKPERAALAESWVK